MPKLNNVDTFEEEGQKHEETGENVIPDPSVDEYVVFYYTSFQPGVPEHVYKFKQHCD